MSARIPLDVDLEDKLLYGLTPTRLIYLVVSLLAAFAAWSGGWTIAPIRGACAVAVAIAGAAAAWGRWQGRALDGWVTDVALYCAATYRIAWRLPRFKRLHPFRRT